MNSQRLNDDLTDTEYDNLELDSFTDVIKAKDMVQTSRYTARRRIEELKEEQRLRKKMESYDDWDQASSVLIITLKNN